jgi:hypothetical protein
MAADFSERAAQPEVSRVNMAEVISTLADISAIWLVILSFIACLIPLALVGGMVYGMYKLLKVLPPSLKRGQEGMVKVAEGADRASHKVAAPFISASALVSQIRGSLRSLVNMIRRKA